MRQVSRRKLMVGTAAVLTATAAPAQENSSGTDLPPADQATVDAKYANVIRKYGERLSEAQRTRAREVLVRHQRMLMRVRAFALENGDAPATGLRLQPEKRP
jgi:hypothetical protein